MNGAQSLIATALASGIEVCFANPGTTELPLVLAMDTVPGLRGVLCLHENVATGAADGYARMSGKSAMCLLHLGPGLANGLTNLHNARRAGTPVLNIIGEHASWHRGADPLLASDIEALARTVSSNVRRLDDPATIFRDVRDAVQRTNFGIVSLIVPHDLQIADTVLNRGTATELSFAPRTFLPQNVDAAAAALKSPRCAILLGGEALSESGLKLAGQIATKCGAALFSDTFFAKMERGAGMPRVTKLPYFPDHALDAMKPYERVVIAGTRRPVAFFGYPGMPSHLTTGEQTVLLSGAEDDTIGALKALADQLHAHDTFVGEKRTTAPARSGALNADTVSAVIARLQPENCILMDEALTVGIPYFEHSKGAPRFTHLMLTGGAIGQGPSSATGAAMACPDRKVINFQSDGSGAYSVQALWTQAREQLDVVTIIGSNHSYNILNIELLRAGLFLPGKTAHAMASLNKPYLDWVKISEGFGVPGVAVETAEALAAELEKALAQKGPRLIEAVMA